MKILIPLAVSLSGMLTFLRSAPTPADRKELGKILFWVGCGVTLMGLMR